MLGSLVTAIGVINDDDENEIEGTIDVVVVVVWVRWRMKSSIDLFACTTGNMRKTKRRRVLKALIRDGIERDEMESEYEDSL